MAGGTPWLLPGNFWAVASFAILLTKPLRRRIDALEQLLEAEIKRSPLRESTKAWAPESFSPAPGGRVRPSLGRLIFVGPPGAAKAAA